MIPSGAPPADAADAAADGVEVRRTHPATPWVHAGQTVPAGFGIGLLLSGSLGVSGPGRLVAIGVVIGLVAAAAAAFQVVVWYRLVYWFDGDGDLRVDSGLFQRNERRLQLSRVQSVEVVQSWLARLVGMGAVRIEAAGSGSSSVELAFFPLDEAHGLRNELLARAAGLDASQVSSPAPERVLATVPTSDLVLSILLRGSTVALVGTSLFFLVVTFVFEGVGAFAVAVVTGGVPAIAVVNEYLRHHGFTVAESPDGLRVRSGLVQTAAVTVPPGRLQAVGFEEPWLWRRFGWVKVRINVGGTAGSRDGDTTTVLLPVTTWDVALSVVGRILPDVDVRAVPMAGVPGRARRRSPVQWRHIGVGHDERVFVARRGRVRRFLSVVPHARTQSVRVTQGPWERSLGLATIHVDSTPGPVGIVGLHLDAAHARSLAEAQADRARDARLRDVEPRWMRPRRST